MYVSIGGDIQPLEKALKTLNKSVASTQKELKAVERLLKLDPKNTTLLSQKQELLAKNIETTKNKLNTLKETQTKVQAQYENGEIDKGQYRKLQREIINTEQQLSKMESELKNTSQELGSSDNKLSKFGKTLTDAENKAGKMNKTVRRITEAVGAMGITLAGISYKKFTDFETSLAKVSTIADTTKVSIDDIKSGVLDLSNATGVSAEELNEALYQAISASVDTAGAVDFLDTAVKASKGGFTDVAVAVDGLTSVMNTYGMSVDEAEKLANQFLITQNKGKTTFGELASSIGKLAPVANAVGLSTQEMFSSLASVTAQGLQTSEAVTALKSAISNIIKPTKEAEAVAKSLGIEFSVSAVQSKGWLGFLKEIKEKVSQTSPELGRMLEKQRQVQTSMAELEKQGKKNSNEYKTLSKSSKQLKEQITILTGAADLNVTGFSKLFGSVEGLNSILMLTSETGMQAYNGTMEEMQTNTTALDDAFNKMNSTQGQAWSEIKTQVENLAIGFGEKLIPVAEAVLDFFQWVLDNSETISFWLITIGGALLTFNVITMIQGLVKSFKDWKTVTEGVTLAQQLLNMAMKMNPIALVASLIVGLVLAITQLWDKCESFRNFVNGFFMSMWNGLLDTLYRVWEVLKFIINIFNPFEWFSGGQMDTLQNIINGRPKEIKLAQEYTHKYTSDLSSAVKGINIRAGLALNRAVAGNYQRNSYVRNNYNVNMTNTFGDKVTDKDINKMVKEFNKKLGRATRW